MRLDPRWWIRELVYRIRTRHAEPVKAVPEWVDVTHLVNFTGGGQHMRIRYSDGAQTDHEVTKMEAKVDPLSNIRSSIEYAMDQYGKPSLILHYLTPNIPPEELAERRARVDAAQPRLRDAVAMYRTIALRDDMVGKIAAMHGPGFNGAPAAVPWRHCDGCPGDDNYGQPDWPCATAELIAKEAGIDLEDLHLYRWEGEK